MVAHIIIFFAQIRQFRTHKQEKFLFLPPLLLLCAIVEYTFFGFVLLSEDIVEIMDILGTFLILGWWMVSLTSPYPSWWLFFLSLSVFSSLLVWMFGEGEFEERFQLESMCFTVCVLDVVNCFHAVGCAFINFQRVKID